MNSWFKSSAMVAAALFYSVSAAAADWTPAFTYLEAGKKGDGGKVIDSVLEDLLRKDAVDSEYNVQKDTLNPNAKRGIYRHVPAPYRQDMLAAVQAAPHELKATIPLKNATLYGHKITALTHWSCAGCGDVGFYATFAPMNDTQYKSLVKKIKFQKYSGEDAACHDKSALITKEHGEIRLYILMDC